ncbi:glucosamine-1-phosphate N-acetyltransferase [Sulfurifustis variabilis]|uniref:Bifunctional protein GlmU n=1 Tax=Sulfurifustis variabilis TaxID=1675686 RepID=A0A1C7AG33_9GAMM|nr:bifunctional UDP-N-acetylglucosamine diphosphorylase/glucosamine-1-phosphate N-acetyltransferase GlmU [Sulfurifustis variabilis]BAU50423.1 glucosamine-1-phosphate N-acetyltransferase [Sulfurifustis variabilis]
MPHPLEIVVLAAGKGTRMRSDRPKVLHDLAGRPLLHYVLETARALAPRAIHVVYGHGGERVREACPGEDVRWVLQAEQNGTGHALRQALPAIPDAATVLVLYGDVPLIRRETLQTLVEAAGGSGVSLLTVTLDDPAGYGRIVRDGNGRIERIVERKDASAAELALHEVNTGFMAAPAARLKGWIARLTNHNAQGEYYLTDIIGMAAGDGLTIAAREPSAPWETLGVNSKAELAQLERVHQHNQARTLMEQGVTVRDPARFDVRGSVAAGRDVEIDVNVVLEGRVVLGDGTRIGPNCYLRDVEIGAGTVVLPQSVLEESSVGRECRIGPFARLRPGTRLADHAHVGNFVEIKNAEVGEGSKINHLTYVGDARVGRDVNVGAGTITCNYDGANKHRTVIEDRAFIGSNTALVAPVTVGADATIGAGSVITRDAPAGQLTLTRAEQKTRPGWKRPTRKK